MGGLCLLFHPHSSSDSIACTHLFRGFLARRVSAIVGGFQGQGRREQSRLGIGGMLLMGGEQIGDGRNCPSARRFQCSKWGICWSSWVSREQSAKGINP